MTQFVRWVPRVHAPAALISGLVSHNTSAMWVFDLAQAYRPAARISNGSILIAYDLDATATANILNRGHIDFEDNGFNGEAQHPECIIVKNNEPGAYGLGSMRQRITNMHTTSRYATKREVARALGLSEREVGAAYRPTTGWP